MQSTRHSRPDTEVSIVHVSLWFTPCCKLKSKPAIYMNEKACGEGIRKFMDDTKTLRSDIFVLSKLYNNSHRKEDVEKALDVTLSDLGLGGQYIAYGTTLTL